jgi:hypothetical protein
MSEKKPYYGKVQVSKIYGGKEGQKTVGLRFEPKEAEQLANWLLQASHKEKIIDVTAYRETHEVTVTAP